MTPADEGIGIDRRSCRKVAPKEQWYAAPAQTAAAADGGTFAQVSDA
jgi:hypothetical protein